MTLNTLDHIFSPEGALAAAVSGFCPRTQQLEMAQKVAEAIRQSGILIAEAGTGTGKTFAYLVPALTSGGKVIISTGTKTLQDQLYNKDLPLVRDALKIPAKIALLKGRANYICHYYLRRSETDGRFASRQDAAYFAEIRRFSKITRTGDKAECVNVPEDLPVWQQVTSTRENCLGQECPDFKDCYLQSARREAMDADLLVVNHHLFFADVMLREEGTAELLPACNTVIFDEAHQLPEIAAIFFGENVSTAQVIDLVRDGRAEALASARDCLDLINGLPLLEKAARNLRLSVGVDTGRFSARWMEERPEFSPALSALTEELGKLAEIFKTQAGRSEGLEKCWQRVNELQARFLAWQTDTEQEGIARWGEAFTLSLQLNATPLSISEIFQKQLDSTPRAWIFTSATLAVQGRFDHYQQELGLNEAQTGYWDSPFDYSTQALLYAPMGLPEPNSYGYTEAVVKAALPLLETCKGGVFFLCTSLKAMRRVHELLEEHFMDKKEKPPLLLQGECGKNELLGRFRQAGNAILIGSQSFWEGVDVRGEALSLVIIDKLPFAPPDDPVLSARIEKMKQNGMNPFMEYQLPHAVINVKQGAGRLIRTETDRGILMICDPRMINKPYGKKVWRSLPPMKRTRELPVAMEFFSSAK